MPVPDFVQTEQQEYVRDTRSGALLNHDKAALARNRAMRIRAHAQQQDVWALRTTINELQRQVAELTQIITTHIQR